MLDSPRFSLRPKPGTYLPATVGQKPDRDCVEPVQQESADSVDIGMHSIRLSNPAEGLQEYVRFYAHREGRLGKTLVHPVPARAAHMIDFAFGDSFEIQRYDSPILEKAHRTTIVGLQTYRRVQLRMTGTIESFSIFFQPVGLHRMFHLPMHELTDTDLEGREVFGPWITDLEQRLGDSRSFEERVRIANEYLLRYCGKQPGLRDVSQASRAILRRRGDIQISLLAQHAGISGRQFERKFALEVGVGPKLLARIARFEAALESKAMSTGDSWANVANQFGYHDQMHMIRDFKQFSGEVPTSLLDHFETIYEGHLIGRRSNRQAPTLRRHPPMIL